MSASFLAENDLSDPVLESAAILPISQMATDAKDEYWATLTLRHCRGLGPRRQARLLKHFGSARLAVENTGQWEALGIPDTVISEMACEKWRRYAEDEWEKASKVDAVLLLWQSPAYPQRLRELPDPPVLLYCRGNTQLLDGPAIAIVGSRKASEYSLEVAAAFGKSISSCGITVISGMAEGIDKYTQAAALRRVGKSIGVLGTGIDKIYPWSNKELFEDMLAEGLLLSEFSPGTPPVPANFPIRNRIISGLSLGVLVVEASAKSGSLITARLALEQNREVFAIPCPAMDDNSMGCQNLIRNGATTVFGVEDILNNLKAELSSFKVGSPEKRILPSPPPTTARLSKKSHKNTAQIPANSEQAKIAGALATGDRAEQVEQCLLANGPMLIDMLADMLNIPAGDLSSLLLGLEMLGKIRRLPGARYEAVKK